VLLSGCANQPPSNSTHELIIIGNDEKITWDDNGKQVLLPPGNDSVSIIDVADHMNPKIIVSLPLMNSIFGPPTNLAITPDQKLSLVANSLDWVRDNGDWKPVPDNKLYVIDLESNPPELIDTVMIGKQPSGMAINSTGDLALIANRADNSISVVKISGKSVRLIDTVPMGDSVANVAISPDGKRALAVKFPVHKVALLEINGEKVTYNKQDMPTGLWPYNLGFTPDGKVAITADNGNSGSSDGHVDTVSVIDMEANPPRVIDKVVVGDAPEGFAISPTGMFAVAVLLRGTNAAKGSWFYHRNALVVGLRIDGKKVTHTNDVEVRGLPEGVAFSSDGNYVYVGTFWTATSQSCAWTVIGS
jgi:DNA-binding beta-propeller fold protein YncE